MTDAGKWGWMMDWCKNRGVSPAVQFWWEMAHSEYLKSK